MQCTICAFKTVKKLNGERRTLHTINKRYIGMGISTLAAVSIRKLVIIVPATAAVSSGISVGVCFCIITITVC